jgi:predicted nucleotidyltransferase
MRLNTNSIAQAHIDDFTALISEYEQILPIAAIFGYGSYFSGNFQKNSDVDLLILSNSKCYEKKLTQKGLLFEVFHIGIPRFRHMLDNYHPCYVPAIAGSEIIYDAAGVALKVKELANNRYLHKPPYYRDSKAINILRSKLRTIIADMRDTVSDLMLFNLYQHQLILLIYKVLCFHHQVWGKGEKQMFTHIKSLSPILYEQIKQSLEVRDNHEKMQLSEYLVITTLAPYGGILALDERLIC